MATVDAALPDTNGTVLIIFGLEGTEFVKIHKIPFVL
jgi:hypothetical protein